MKILVTLGVLAFSLVHSAKASEVFTFSQSGTNVVVTGSGSLNLTGLTYMAPVLGNAPGIIPFYSNIGVGAPGSTGSVYFGFTGPQAFGTGTGTSASTSTGQFFGFQTGGSRYTANQIFIPTGYVSGAALAGTDTFNNATFASLGVNPGTYTFTLPNDTIVVNIPGVPAVAPEPSSIVLLGTGVLAMAGMASRRFAR